LKIETQQFGTVEFDDNAILTFDAGILGFEDLHRFLLIDQDEIAPLRWFQPLDEPSLAFTTLDPFLFFPDYHVAIAAEDRRHLGLQDGQVPILLVLVTIPENPEEMTANLLGPLVINPDTHRGKQVVLHDSGYPVRRRLIPGEAQPTESSPATV
jgi:flagellar assembly factor FliW